MINLNDLWIGDLVKLTKSGRIGKFEGIHKSGKARVNINGKIILTTANNLDTYTPPEEPIVIEDLVEKRESKPLSSTLDLHIESLRPDLLNALPERILDFQFKAFEAYLERVKNSHINECIIVHGKGAGVLKSMVHSRIKNDKKIKLYEVIHDGGATKLLL